MRDEKKKTYTKVYAKVIESGAYDQIKLISDSPSLRGLIAIMPDCLTEDTEVLTETGFKKIIKLSYNDRIANYNKDSSKIFFASPKNIIYRFKREDEIIYEYFNDKHGLSINVSENHRMALKDNFGEVAKNISEIKIADMVFCGEELLEDGFDKYSDNDLRLISWIIGDGNIKVTHNTKSDNYRIRFGLKKKRKINRIISLLEEENLNYKLFEDDKQTSIYINTEESKKYIEFVTLSKSYPLDFIFLNKRQSEVLYAELIQVDGDYTNYLKSGSYRLNSSKKFELDLLSAIFSSNGHYTKITKRNIKSNYATESIDMFYLSVVKENKMRESKSGTGNRVISRREIDYKGSLVCVECDSTYFIARQNGIPFVTGNCHIGKGSVIGFTGHFDKAVIPNIIGVDIGCGVMAYPIGKEDVDFNKLDEYIRWNIPLGFNRRNPSEKEEFVKETEKGSVMSSINIIANKVYENYRDPLDQVGTLGGGNHFIEIGENEDGERYLLIHSGSRNIGKQIAEYHQKKAIKICKAMQVGTPKDLEYLPLEFGGNEYLTDMKVAQQFASLNREVMLKIILRHLNIKFNKEELIESIHNFIGKDNIIRKGAISAYKGERVIIPFNMAEGSIIGVGKSNKDYNFSAPHGAGRVFGRNVMKNKLRSGELTMDDFKDSMKGIFSTSIKEGTIDESKFAYKSYDDVKEHLEETIDVTMRLKSIYNLKSG